MKYEITWKWNEFSKALHLKEVNSNEESKPNRIYVLFTDKSALQNIVDVENKPYKGINSNMGINNVLYVGMASYERNKEELKGFPVRIGERILSQGHSAVFDIFLNEPGPIFLGIVEINEPYFTFNSHIENIEAYLIHRLGPRYNKKNEKGNIPLEKISLKSKIHDGYLETFFTGFMTFED